MASEKYAKKELYEPYKRKYYTNKHTQAAFLLGGIGTGNISIGSRGQLRDLEIFNAPGKGNTADYTFFTLWSKEKDKEPVTKVLEGQLGAPYYSSALGHATERFAGLPRFKESRMSSEYPFVQVDLKDISMPLEVSMEAFTPFIPLNADDSGIPGAIIRYKVKNTSEKAMEVAIAGTLANLTGFIQNSSWGFVERVGRGDNQKRQAGEIQGIFMDCKDIPSRSSKYGNLSLMTREKEVTIKPTWYQGTWWDGLQEFWDDFSQDGQLGEEMDYINMDVQIGHKATKIGSLATKKEIQSGEEVVFEFILTWYIPNRPKSWTTEVYKKGAYHLRTVKNHYATLFKDSWEAGEYLAKNIERLEGLSRDFSKALYQSTLPSQVIEAMANNITVIRSNTCFRIKGGHFLAWEGCQDQSGSCHGTCTHVWNYAQTLAFLFPTLEQSARKTEFLMETSKKGKMNFRTEKHFTSFNSMRVHHAAADGQLGTVIRLYREWKLSGNDDLLKRTWPYVKKVIDYGRKHWDADGDNVLDCQQHNTYDIEFYGPNSLVNSLFYGALKAAARMADYLGEKEVSSQYTEAFNQGSKRMDALLWNGEYYSQELENVDDYKYQYGKGCLADQLFGQTLAHITGLGYVLPKEHVKIAVKAIYDNNFKDSMEKHVNVQRTYALNDEAGLLLCSWPKGGRPRFPFIYSDEVWSGIEYQVATHLIYEDFIEEGLRIVKACRERYDGIKRNPWSEMECGHHYARSLASWGLLLALSGFEYDMTKDHMTFGPVIHEEDFKCFWSTGKAWGTYHQTIDEAGEIRKDIEILYKVV